MFRFLFLRLFECHLKTGGREYAPDNPLRVLLAAPSKNGRAFLGRCVGPS